MYTVLKPIWLTQEPDSSSESSVAFHMSIRSIEDKNTNKWL